MDADLPSKDDRPSAKVIPLPAKPNEAVYEVDPPMNEDRFKRIVAEAIGDSVWSKTREEDREALEHEQAFRCRFGFVVNRTQRQRVLELKHADDLTDGEIRQLWWSASLDLKSSPARNMASPFIQWFGYGLIAVLCLQMLLGILAVARANERSLMQLAQITTVEAVLMCLLAAVSYFYVRPNQIRLRALQESGR